MDIIAKRRDFFQTLSPHIPAKLIHLFTFGYETLVAQPVTSTRANARRSSHGWHTAKSKMYRLLKNERLASVLPTLVSRLNLVSDSDVIAVDFSDFGNGMQVLMFAKQTKQGRALPLYFEVLQYPIEKDSQNLFVIAAIERFYAVIGCTPTLVFDRGFACPSIIQYLAHSGYTFIIRIKKRKKLTTGTTKRTVAAEEHTKHDSSVIGYGHTLRLVRSDQPDNENDPWYLVTNDTDKTRDEIITRYYHRFEIEELFRDAKHILKLEWVRFKTTQSLMVALWFALITTWLFETVASALTTEQERQRQSWRLSRFRYVFELLEHMVWRQADLGVERPPGSG